MIDVLFLAIHLLLLSGINLLAFRKQKLITGGTMILAVFVLIWFELILTGYSVSIFGLLGHRIVYVSSSIFYSILFSILLYGYIPKEEINPDDKQTDFSFFIRLKETIRSEPYFVIFSIFISVIVFLSLLICAYYFPNNPDSESYRIPRAYFYRSHGSLTHFAIGVDPRLIVYPLHGVLGHMVVAIHNVDLRWTHLFTFSAWISVLLCAYIWSRTLGASRSAAAFASFLIGSTPIFLVLSAAGNDEILAAAPMMIGIYFGHLWVTKNKNIFWILASISIFISLGVKEHYAFYWMFFFVLGIWILASKKISYVFDFVKSKFGYLLISSLFFLFALTSAVLISHYSGGITSSGFGPDVINYPFRLMVGFQNLGIYFLQIFLTPLPDMFGGVNTSAREILYKEFQNFFEYFLFWVNRDPSYFNAYFPLRGLMMIPEAVYRAENSVWFGYVPVFLMIMVVVFRKSAKLQTDTFQFWLLASHLLWIVAFAFTIRFTYTIQTYFAYGYVFLAPVFALFWTEFERRKIYDKNLLRIIFAFVIFTNLLFDYRIFTTNLQRNIIKIQDAKFKQFYSDEMTPELETLLKNQKEIFIKHTHWEMPFMHIIRRNPSANFTVENEIPHEKTNSLNLLIYQARSEYHFLAINLPKKNTLGLVYLGKLRSAYGPEFVFSNGRELPGFPNKYIVLLNYSIDIAADSLGKQHAHLIIRSGDLSGEHTEDNLQYSFNVKDEKGNILGKSNWDYLFTKSANIDFDFGNKSVLEVLVKERNGDGKVYTYHFPLENGIEYFVQ
ncbi:hypothetical protein [Leptospira sp. 'Mane']|uniref:hypothetical protein n=1 Tax=Leptospira sp. 'Mane' TaxID=3387407 RepID=UPI00398AAEB4